MARIPLCRSRRREYRGNFSRGRKRPPSRSARTSRKVEAVGAGEARRKERERRKREGANERGSSSIGGGAARPPTKPARDARREVAARNAEAECRRRRRCGGATLRVASRVAAVPPGGPSGWPAGLVATESVTRVPPPRAASERAPRECIPGLARIRHTPVSLELARGRFPTNLRLDLFFFLCPS